MKRFLLACGGAVFLFTSAHPASAQLGASPGVNPCPPADYVCSLAATGAEPLSGSPDDGEPISALGFLVFDGHGGVTGTVEVNDNGTVATDSKFKGTCTSGTGGKPGTIQVSSQGVAFTFGFVVALSFGSIDLILSNNTAGPTPNTPVELGVCHASIAG